ncbi:beta-lactamase/transpeptidase-like protein [Mycena polygramma]|nr:beta-lactamase/transpeptidase-like protein [Mycena polygramma]
MPVIVSEQQDAIRGIMSRAVESNTVPALFCGVSDQNGEIFMHQAGRKVLGDPSSDALDENAIFWIASQTKLITSIAALQLIEQGKLQLSTVVSEILPELANPVVVTARDAEGRPSATSPAKSPITLEQLLNHTSGLQYGQPGPPYGSRPYEDTSAWFDEKKGSLSGQPLAFEPGSNCASPLVYFAWTIPYLLLPVEYGYSADCVGFIVERISGKSLEQYFQDHIFAPLEITSASFYLTSDLKERLLPMSFRSDNKLVRWNHQVETINENPETTKVHFGGAGLFMSEKDYLAVLRHILQIKAGNATNPIISASSVESLFKPTLAGPAPNSLGKMLSMPEGSAQFSTGLMVTTVDLPGRRKKGTGAWGGYACTSYFIDPETGIAAVFGTQLVPSFDLPYETLWIEVEEAIYAGLQK